MIAAQTGLAGTVTVGDGAVLGGKVGVKDNITIGEGATLAAYAAVMDNVPPGVVWVGCPAREFKEAFREHAATRKLPEMLKIWRAERNARNGADNGRNGSTNTP